MLEKTPSTKQAISSDTAAELTAAMEKVMTDGTGVNAYFSTMPLAGKSGTTNDNVDAWFFGYSPYYTCGVWGGYDENQSQESGTYVQTLWKAIMSRAHESLTSKDFTATENLKSYTICGKCGKLAKTGICNDTVQGDVTEEVLLPESAKPSESCDCHVAVSICSSSGQRAGSNCPSTYTVVYLKEGTTGTDDEAYTEPNYLLNVTCETHDSLWAGLFGSNSQNHDETEQDSSSGHDDSSYDGSYSDSNHDGSSSSGNSQNSGNNNGNSSGSFWGDFWGGLFG